MFLASSRAARRAALFVSVLLSLACGGCAVVTVAGAAVGVAATGAGLAVDAAVGTARVVGGAVGAALPGRSDD